MKLKSILFAIISMFAFVIASCGNVVTPSNFGDDWIPVEAITIKMADDAVLPENLTFSMEATEQSESAGTFDFREGKLYLDISKVFQWSPMLIQDGQTTEPSPAYVVSLLSSESGDDLYTFYSDPKAEEPDSFKIAKTDITLKDRNGMPVIKLKKGFNYMIGGVEVGEVPRVLYLKKNS
ncbi:MAG: hypothetical protein ACRC4W_03320 [Treponemataceae bacterium]